MLKSTFLASSAVAALLLCTACDRPGTESQSEAQNAQPAAETPPTASERAAAEAANEVEQVASPTTQISPEELAAGTNAENVDNPETTLATAAVKTSSGDAVGEVRSVVVGPDGKADAVIVEVGGFLNVGERAVSIDAKKFTYLKDRNLLVAALARSDIEQLPAAPPQQ